MNITGDLAGFTFIILLVFYLAIGTTLLIRSPSRGWGFPMFVFVYPLFLVALFFASTRSVVLVWLGLSLVNMAIQFVYMRRQRVPTGAAGVMFASLFLWPVQFAAVVSSSRDEQSTRESKEVSRKKIGPLPSTIKGTVSYAQHIGTEVGHDVVFLEEFVDLEFLMDARKYEQLGIAEGKTFSLTVEEREAPDDIAPGTVLWIVDGEPIDS